MKALAPSRFVAVALILTLPLTLAGCPAGCGGGAPGTVPPDGGGKPGPSGTDGTGATGPAPTRFVDVTEAAGVRFEHFHGGTGKKYFPETMCGGVMAFDHDGDGDQDLYFVQGGSLPWREGQSHRNVLLRNDGGMKFTDVSEASGLDDDGYGMGCCAGDIDNDGDLDVYVTNFGTNRLFRNEGDGTFEDVTEEMGVGDNLWGASAAFADYDGDGLLDLYVVNYVDFTVANHKACGKKQPGYQAYCHPDEYEGVDDVLYRNAGAEGFEDVTRTALPGPIDPKAGGKWISGSLEGKGLGVIWEDYDRDGFPDIFVANDSTANYLFRNKGDGSFDFEITAGFGYNEEGRTEASMGIDAADVNGDGWMDIYCTHLDGETNTLYLNGADGTFEDMTNWAGLGIVSTPYVGFGTNFLDFDNDGDADLYVGNGHIIDNIEKYKSDGMYAMPDLLFENDGTGKFENLEGKAGPHFERPTVARGSAVADLDGDGDLDLAICNSNTPAVLLRNDGGHRKAALRVELVGTRGNRSAVGAQVKIEAAGRTQIDVVRAGTSYCGQSELTLHFGLGDATRVDRLEVTWPDGEKETFEGVEPGQTLRVEEGKGIVARRPFTVTP